MQKKKNIIIVICLVAVIILAVVLFVFLESKKIKTNDTLVTSSDIKTMLNTIYKNLGDDIPSLDTEEITLDDSDMVKSLTGLEDTKDIKTLVVSEPLMNAQALEVAVLKTNENANVNGLMESIKNSVNMDRWICVSAEKLYLASSGDVIFMVMADSDWAKSIYDEFVKYMDNKIDKTLERDNTFDGDIDSEFPDDERIPVAD